VQEFGFNRAKAGIGWSLERDGPLNKGGGFYHRSIKSVIDRDGDTLTVLAKQVGVRVMFSDWPATTTFYANCVGDEVRGYP
jgi:glycerophosphoryl diester phosphodiesterase